MVRRAKHQLLQASAMAGLLLLAILLGAIGMVLHAKGTQSAAEVTEIIGGILAICALAPPFIRQLRQADQQVTLTLDDIKSAKEILAALVQEQWRVEAVIRSLDDPDPIPVEWHLTEHEDMMDHPGHIASGTLSFTGRSDYITGLADAFRQLRRRRLVILGGPGSGKTTLSVQLVLELLRTHIEGEPIPVLFLASNWDTATYPRFQDWLTVQLNRDYPALRAQNSQADTSQVLVTRAQVLPVLDGLDELPEEARADVIAKLNQSLAADDQLILTSRTKEFAFAVKSQGNVLRSAAVIEPQTLTAETVASYLQNCLPPKPDAAWSRVLGNLQGGRSVALAEITATPLGTWLLRTVYITAGRSPAPLRGKRLRDPRALWEHLLEGLIPALISSRTPTDAPAEIYRPQRHWDPEDVRRWLGYHAWALNNLNAEIAPDYVRDIPWWQLAGYTMRPRTIGLCISILGICSGLVFGTAIGIAGGLSAGVKLGLFGALITGPGTAICMGVIIGVLAATRWIYDQPGYANLHIKREKSTVSNHAKRTGVERGIKSPAIIALFVAVMLGGPGVLAGAFGAALVVGLTSGLLVWLAAMLFRWAETPAATDRAITPISSWRADRTLIIFRVSVFITVFILASVLAGLVYDAGNRNQLLSILTGIAAISAVGFIFGLVTGNHHAWLLYVLACLRLTRMRLYNLPTLAPYRLMLFLQDCHRLGLLRAVGPTYQFRHAEIQDYLARSFPRVWRSQLSGRWARLAKETKNNWPFEA